MALPRPSHPAVFDLGPAIELIIQWLPCGALVADRAGSLLHANPAACTLLGCATEGELARGWHTLAGAVGIVPEGNGAIERGTVARDDPALPPVRYERFPLESGGSVTLVTPQREVPEAETPLLLANEAMLFPLLVSQLVHDVRGRTNEVRMSLAAANAVMRHALASAPSENARAIVEERLQAADSSCQSLSQFVTDWRAEVLPAPGSGRVDLHSIAAHLPDLLMHPSLIRGVSCNVDAGAPGRWTRGDVRRLRIALCGLALFLVEHAEENGCFTFHFEPDPTEHVITMTVDGLEEGTPSLDAVHALVPAADLVTVPLHAARRVVEAHGGTVSVLTHERKVGLQLTLPVDD